MTLTFTLIAVPLGGLFMPLFEARAQQIAEANGFDALLPTDVEMNLDAGLPVDETERGDGLAIGYDRFTLAQRAATGALGYEYLEARVEPGQYPVGDIGPGSAIPQDAEYLELEVDAAPAIGVSYRAVTEEKADDLTGTDSVNVLIFERDGVEVVLYSQGFMEYQSDGSYQPRDPLPFDELIEIAETLAPIE
ncbi:hypothetical protein EG835_10240 [bacterium]|nr:hypothetical protein [bacterium]